MAEIKNSHRAIQVSQNQGAIFFQFPVKTIISFCSIWAFLGTVGPRIKYQKLFQKLLIKVWLLVKQFWLLLISG